MPSPTPLGAAAHAVALLTLPPGGRAISWAMAFVAALVVITCYRLSERASSRLRALVEHSGGLLAIVDRDLRVVSVRGPAPRLLGVDAPALVGASTLSLVHTDDRGPLLEVLTRAVADPAAAAVLEARLLRPDDVETWAEIGVEHALDDPAIGGVVLTVRDITERKRLEGQLVHQAFHDPLTGLANRALFADRVDHALARRRPLDQGLAVFFVDLDDFKAVNDTLGHAAGDELLGEVARRLATVARAGDTVARLGGDEFAILVEDVTGQDVVDGVARRLRDAFAAPVQLAAGEVPVGASLGAAVSSVATVTGEDLLRNADIAMYRAKHDGKGHFQQFDETMHHELLHRLQLKTDLRRAVARGELRLQYQPTMDLSTRRVHGVEALLRWHHPQLGTIPPADFIPLAEETGDIVAIGRWVLQVACADARRWNDLRPDEPQVALHVNVSGRQLERDGFVAEVEEVLRGTGLPAAGLVLEITESVLLDDLDAAVARLQLLRRLGVRVAIDDFGTGYSSLSYLSTLPVDLIKVDKSFATPWARATAPGRA